MHFQEIHMQDIDVTEMAGDGVHVPELVTPLNIENLWQVFDPNGPSQYFGADIYSAVVHHVENVVNVWGWTEMQFTTRCNEDTQVGYPFPLWTVT